MRSEAEIRKALEHFTEAYRGAMVENNQRAALSTMLICSAIEWALEEETSPAGMRVSDIIAEFEEVDAAARKAASN